MCSIFFIFTPVSPVPFPYRSTSAVSKARKIVGNFNLETISLQRVSNLPTGKR
jgi:hypothetical protein